MNQKVKQKHIVCKVDEIDTGDIKQFHIERAPIIVARNSPDKFSAFYGLCPHQGGDFNRSHLTYETSSENPGSYEICKKNEMIRCPWHGFEFDTNTGCSVFDEKRMRMKTYTVYVENEHVVVEL